LIFAGWSLRDRTDEAGASSEHPRLNGKSIWIVDDTVAPLVLFLII
jgi:hypothetical protein